MLLLNGKIDSFEVTTPAEGAPAVIEGPTATLAISLDAPYGTGSITVTVPLQGATGLVVGPCRVMVEAA